MAREEKRKTGIYRGGLDDAPISARARVVVVHDCARPIARAIALHLADRGQCVLACGSDPLALHDLPRETALGGVIEVSSAAYAKRRARALELFGRVDAVVAVAECRPELTWGPFEGDDPAAPLDEALLGPTRFASELSGALTSAGAGRLVLVNTLPGLPFGAAAAAARGGFLALSEALRVELAPLGVEVLLVTTELALAPPPTPTPLEALEQALARLGPGRPRQALAGPLRTLLARAASHASIAKATVDAILAPRPKATIHVRAAGRLVTVRASRALRRVATKAPR
jgi:NAD(P)-dependent dehydrogenase (short-subunit alcohol dehydrogenase family)